MEYSVQPDNPYSPIRPSGYFDTFVHNTQSMHDPTMLDSTLNCLRGQKQYLDELLSKTAVTLNALRDRQTRNDRILSAHPAPRSKRKKIQQNRYKTGKTIKTCENEERAIFSCLQVCETNIHTLEAILYPPDLSSWTSTDYYSNNSYMESDRGSLDWNGWTDDSPISPFKRERERPLPMDEIPPETPLPAEYVDIKHNHPPPLPPRLDIACSSVLPLVPPNSAYTNFAFSPEATTFEPSTTQIQLPVARLSKELDKLTISGYLAAKRKRWVQSRQFSDVTINQMIRRLPGNAPPASAPARPYQSWAYPKPAAQNVSEHAKGETTLKRCNSI